MARGVGLVCGTGRARYVAGRRGHTNTDALVMEPGWQRTANVQPPVMRPFIQETGPTIPLPVLWTSSTRYLGWVFFRA